MAWVLERETRAGAFELARFRSPVDALTRLGSICREGRERFPLRIVSDLSGDLLARHVPGASGSCSASTTATNSQKWDSGRV